VFNIISLDWLWWIACPIVYYLFILFSHCMIEYIVVKL